MVVDQTCSGRFEYLHDPILRKTEEVMTKTKGWQLHDSTALHNTGLLTQSCKEEASAYSFSEGT